MVSSRASTNNSFHTVASCICNCVEENKLLRQQLSQAKEDQEINKRRYAVVPAKALSDAD